MQPSPSRYGPLGDALPPQGWLVLACCVAILWTLVALAAVAVPGWVVAPLPVLTAAVAVERAISHAYVHRHRLVREHLRSYRAQEALGLVVLALLALLLTRLVVEGPAVMAGLARAFLTNPLALVDRTAVVWAVALVIAAALPAIPLDLLQRLEPQLGEVGPAPGEPGYDEWLHSPARHFDHLAPFRKLVTVLTAGCVLEVVAAALVWYARPGFVAQATVAALALICAVAAFVAMSLANRRLRATRWLVDRVAERVEPPGSWARAAAGLVAAVVVVALIIPAALLIVLARLVLDGILILGLLLMSVLAIPIPGALGGKLPSVQRTLPPFPTPAPQAPSTGHAFAAPPWAGSALLLILLALAVAFLLVRGRHAIRGKCGLVRRVLAAFVVVWLDVWSALRWLTRRAGTAVQRLAVAVRRRPAAQGGQPRPGARGGRWSARQVIRLLFQSLVREGERSGNRRRPGDTANAYASRLEASVPEQEHELRELARAFELASYSNLSVEREDAEHATSLYYVIRNALRAWVRRRRAEMDRRGG